MNEEMQLKRIKKILREAKERGDASPEEIMLDLKQVLPPEVRIIEKEPVSTPEKLQYMKDWRFFKKQLQKEEDQKRIKQVQIDKALQRPSIFCYNCKKSIRILDPKTNKYEIVKKKNNIKSNINITNICPICSKKITGFGGHLTEF